MAADHSAEIARLESLLNTGLTSQTTDGQSTAFDLAAIRKRLAELKADHEGSSYRRPRVATIDLRHV